MAGPHQLETAATTDLPNQINNVCMYVDQARLKTFLNKKIMK